MAGENIRKLLDVTAHSNSQRLLDVALTWGADGDVLDKVATTLKTAAEEVKRGFSDGVEGDPEGVAERGSKAFLTLHDDVVERRDQMYAARRVLNTAGTKLANAEQIKTDTPTEPSPLRDEPSPHDYDLPFEYVIEKAKYDTESAQHSADVTAYAGEDEKARKKLEALDTAYAEASAELAKIHGEPVYPEDVPPPGENVPGGVPGGPGRQVPTPSDPPKDPPKLPPPYDPPKDPPPYDPPKDPPPYDPPKLPPPYDPPDPGDPGRPVGPPVGPPVLTPGGPGAGSTRSRPVSSAPAWWVRPASPTPCAARWPAAVSSPASRWAGSAPPPAPAVLEPSGAAARCRAARSAVAPAAGAVPAADAVVRPVRPAAGARAAVRAQAPRVAGVVARVRRTSTTRGTSSTTAATGSTTRGPRPACWAEPGLRRGSRAAPSWCGCGSRPPAPS
ncbi:hypothetical protein [Nocardioides humi]|uniref:hypothetical protein n=1 Tax=Nocardioides humi TaxID=449461 RepID=UPI00112A5D50|nr:hypothetical protein [Nocardioides humi]